CLDTTATLGRNQYTCALRLGKRDKIHYTIRANGEVVLTRAEPSEGDDPVLGQFLGFLARDIASHPERLQAVDVGLVQRLQSLVVHGWMVFVRLLFPARIDAL